MRLISIYDYDKRTRLDTLYRLLEERTPEQSISHKEMPTRKQHEAFVEKKPYSIWYFITPDENTDIILGTLYLTVNREIGIQLRESETGKGYGTEAMKELLHIHRGPFLANIAPTNPESTEFFRKFGFEHIQNTYKLEA